jgi:hypothetical protein
VEFSRRGYEMTVDVRQRRTRYQLTIDVHRERRRDREAECTVPLNRSSSLLDEAAARHLLAAGHRPVAPLR